MQSVPANLKARGISQATWNSLTPAQRKSVVSQSHKVAVKATRAGTPEPRRQANAKARAKRYAAKPASRRRADWPGRDETQDFWDSYEVLRNTA